MAYWTTTSNRPGEPEQWVIAGGVDDIWPGFVVEPDGDGPPGWDGGPVELGMLAAAHRRAGADEVTVMAYPDWG